MMMYKIFDLFEKQGFLEKITDKLRI